MFSLLSGRRSRPIFIVCSVLVSMKYQFFDIMNALNGFLLSILFCVNELRGHLVSCGRMLLFNLCPKMLRSSRTPKHYVNIGIERILSQPTKTRKKKKTYTQNICVSERETRGNP